MYVAATHPRDTRFYITGNRSAEKQPFLWSPFFLSIGILAYFGLRAEPHAFMGAILALIALAFFAMTYQRRDFTARHKVRNLVAFI